MSTITMIAAAGNTATAAFSALLQLGYVVTKDQQDSRQLKAEKDGALFVAEDTLLLLGLVKLSELRGNSWQPTDREIEQFVCFEQSHA